jgi:D-glycero-D-manno-heptose 1,7-bisphosphate phosphatase
VRRAIFLDRDGVINKALVKDGKPYPPKSLSELEIIPGAQDGLSLLKENGFFLVVITNQPDVARGLVTKSSVDDINERLLNELPIDSVKTCYHDDSDNCLCRKPRPGAIIDAAKEFDIDLAASYMVGDRWRDIEAGGRAGCRTIFIDYGYNEFRPLVPDFVVDSLPEAVSVILMEVTDVRT